MRPLTTYTPFRNLNVGNFVLVKPHDLDLVPLWMGRVEGDVVKDKDTEYFKMVKVQWWVPMKKGSKLDERHLYENCWNGKWKCNWVDLEQWLEISAILFSFPIQKNTTNKSQISIPIVYASRAKINFDAINASNNLWRMWVTSMKLYIWNFLCLVYPL